MSIWLAQYRNCINWLMRGAIGPATYIGYYGITAEVEFAKLNN